METVYNPQLKLANDFVQYTDQHIFLTGKAGTGKTTFLLNLRKSSPKRMIVVAPTGVAAINAGGVTIHSFFQLAFGPFVPTGAASNNPAGRSAEASQQANFKRFSKEKINIIRSLDLLVIDEISMVRADLLDGIDEVLRRYKDHRKPFGGVQLLMIGDLQQLAPVVKPEEWEILREYYTTPFFFGSRALQKTSPLCIELKHIYRQSDDAFIAILNKVRDNVLDATTLEALNQRYIPDFKGSVDEGYITLTTHNAQAHNINTRKLEELDTELRQFDALVEGEFPEGEYPTDGKLLLKEGAQVMFVKNDPSHDKLFYNGKIGTIEYFDEEQIVVSCPGEELPIYVTPLDWEKNKYTLDEQSQEIKASVVGIFRQYPLKLAWAITIHKSQGLTFEKVIIDANAAFAHGQVYVALSRCKTLDGIVLSSPIVPQNIKTDQRITGFTHEAEQHQPDEKKLESSIYDYQHRLLLELFDYAPIERRLRHVIKIQTDHKSSLLDPYREVFYHMEEQLNRELIAVSNKFGSQLNQYLSHERNVEANLPLQDRVKKGCEYFLEKTKTLIFEVLQNTKLETDNKTVRKAVNEAMTKLTSEVIIKMECLKVCSQGFQVTTYLTTRAKSAIEKPEPVRNAQTSEDLHLEVNAHPDLFAQLRLWRSEKANEINKPAFVIMHQTTLMELVTQLPDTVAELMAINGFGKKRVDQYGKEILKMIRNYKEENLIPTNDAEEDLDEPITSIGTKTRAKPKKGKINSMLLSLELFRAGKSIAEIAAERGFAVSTIEEHLALSVGTGDLDIDQLVAPEKRDLIVNYFLNQPESRLGQAKLDLGDEVSYMELHVVTQYLKFLQQQPESTLIV